MDKKYRVCGTYGSWGEVDFPKGEMRMGGMVYVLIGVVVLPLLVSMVVRGRYRKVYEESVKVKLSGGLTGAGMARRILEAEGIEDVEIVEHWGLLPDHYDCEKKRLCLSRQHFRGTSAAALGVAAHEAGHAIQDRRRFRPLKKRELAIRYSQYLTPVIVLLPLLMMLTKTVNSKTGIIIIFAGWGAVLAFNLFTLPVEYDASERSKEVVFRKRILSSVKEERALYKMMRAACLMYVSGVLNTVRWLVGSLRSGKRPVLPES
ncbi:MAG: zinc metallopeptidase [Verrucomicrobiota bacterium]